MNCLKNIGLYRLVAILFFLGILIGCQTNTGTNPQNEDALFSIAMSATQIPDEVAYITGELSRDGYDTITESFTFAGDSATADFGSIAVGVWHLNVTAYDSENQILYAGETNVNILAGQLNIVNLQMNPVTGSLTVIVHWGGQAGYSGEFIYMYSNSSRLYRYSFETESLEQILPGQDGAYPFFIPSMDKLGFTNQNIVYAINPDGSNLSQLFSISVMVMNTDYSPVTERIYFYDNTFNGRKLASIDLAGEDLHYFPHPAYSDNTAPTPSPFNNTMLFSSDRNGTMNIYIMDLSTEEATQLTYSQIKAVEPQWDATGNGFYYLEENENGYRSVRHYNFNTQASDLIFSNNDWIIKQIGLSPDGQSLALTGGAVITSNSVRNLHVFDLNTSVLTQLTDAELTLTTPLWLEFN